MKRHTASLLATVVLGVVAVQALLVLGSAVVDAQVSTGTVASSFDTAAGAGADPSAGQGHAGFLALTLLAVAVIAGVVYLRRRDEEAARVARERLAFRASMMRLDAMLIAQEAERTPEAA